MDSRQVTLLYGRYGADLDFPGDAVILSGEDPPPVGNPSHAVASALAIALSTGSLLSIAGRLQGPTLLPYGGAYAEALSFAAVGAVIGGLVLIVGRTTDSRAAV